MRYQGRHTAAAQRRLQCQARQRAQRRPWTSAIGLAAITVGAGLIGAGLAPTAPQLLRLAPAPQLLGAPAAARAAPPALSAEEAQAFAEQPFEAAGEVSVADPGRIVIPALSVDAAVVSLGLRPDGALEVPEDFSQTGWYTDGPEPGEPGSAVIVGHVDSLDGPAVFFRLRELVPGDEIIVETVDGGSFTFIVERVEQHPKAEFPTAAVYGPTKTRALRLITCGGTFDRAARSYQDNLVVFASLAVV